MGDFRFAIGQKVVVDNYASYPEFDGMVFTIANRNYVIDLADCPSGHVYRMREKLIDVVSGVEIVFCEEVLHPVSLDNIVLNMMVAYQSMFQEFIKKVGIVESLKLFVGALDLFRKRAPTTDRMLIVDAIYTMLEAAWVFARKQLYGGAW